MNNVLSARIFWLNDCFHSAVITQLCAQPMIYN